MNPCEAVLTDEISQLKHSIAVDRSRPDDIGDLYHSPKREGDGSLLHSEIFRLPKHSVWKWLPSDPGSV